MIESKSSDMMGTIKAVKNKAMVWYTKTMAQKLHMREIWEKDFHMEKVKYMVKILKHKANFMKD